MPSYSDYNDAAKNRREYELTTYDFDKDLWYNIPEYM